MGLFISLDIPNIIIGLLLPEMTMVYWKYWLYSSFHIAQLQVGMASPLTTGQARTVKVFINEKSRIISEYNWHFISTKMVELTIPV